MEQLWLDLRYAVRMMNRARTLTLCAVLTLALGIGANTAIFTLINALVVRSLPVSAPQELVQIMSQTPGEPMRVGGFPWRVYEHYRDNQSVFSALFGTTMTRWRVTQDGTESETLWGGHVTGNWFPALGIGPAAGRLIGPQDDRVGGPTAAVAVLNWWYWDSRFNRDPAVVGRQITIENVPVTVIGVAPRDFFGLQAGLRPSVWTPAALAPLLQQGGGANSPQGLERLTLGLMGRLKPGVSIDRARAEMRVLDRFRIDLLAQTNSNPLVRQLKLDVLPASSGFSLFQRQWARPLLVLMGVVAVILFLACLNVATMLLARSAARQREMAVRVSLGAGRWRLVRQVLTESLLVSSVAALVGIALAWVGASALLRMLSSGRPLPGLPAQLELDVKPDLNVLLFTAAAAVLTGVVFGSAPAWSAFASAAISPLRQVGESRSRRLFSRSLVVGQVLLSVALLSAAGLFVTHLSRMRTDDLGFQRESVLLVSLEPAGSGYTSEQLTVIYRELLDRLPTIPGVQLATLSSITPLSGAGWSRFVTVEGFPEDRERRRYVSLNAVAPKYFDTFRMPLLAGRDFAFEDAGRPRVAIINLAMADYYFGRANAIGRHVSIEGDAQPYEIIGIVGNAKYSEPREPAPRTMYLNAFQDNRIASQLALRTTSAPTAIVADVRRLVNDTLKGIKVGKVTTLAEQVDAAIVPERLLAAFSGLFALLGAMLAAIGLYGLLAYTIVRRVPEIGVRMALGATRGDITRMVLRTALGLVCVGLVLGASLALLVQRVLTRALSLPAPGPETILVSAGIMVVVGLLAAAVPARRAARVEPTEALRSE
jgi:predicted permease